MTSPRQSLESVESRSGPEGQELLISDDSLVAFGTGAAVLLCLLSWIAWLRWGQKLMAGKFQRKLERSYRELKSTGGETTFTHKGLSAKVAYHKEDNKIFCDYPGSIKLIYPKLGGARLTLRGKGSVKVKYNFSHTLISY